MRRYSKGGVCQQRGRWRALWYENGVKRTRVLGLCKDMTKTEAREAVAAILAKSKPECAKQLFGEFVEGPYFDFYTRKWKPSTAENNKQRIRAHLVAAFEKRELTSIKRDDLQALLDQKGSALSFSVVDHLRWDARQIFGMAVVEGLIERNPAQLLFTPRSASRPVRKTMSCAEVAQCLEVLGQRERLVAKLAILAGLRPGEIFALTWGRVGDTFAEVTQRVYRNKVDTPKTDHSIRQAALATSLIRDLESWRSSARWGHESAFVFSSERGTPLSKDNVWRRNMQPKLATAGLGWANFQVMRRTHATLMRQLKADPKAVADQLGHSVDVSLNVYAQSPVATRLPLVNQLDGLLIQ